MTLSTVLLLIIVLALVGALAQLGVQQRLGLWTFRRSRNCARTLAFIGAARTIRSNIARRRCFKERGLYDEHGYIRERKRNRP